MDVYALVDQIQRLHQHSILRWKSHEVQMQEQDFMAIIEANHAYNYQLWHAEDKARRTDKGDAFVVKAKREIDQYNQKRNNAMESIDQYFIETLQPAPHEHCCVHSETPGMMIDRLSILALKIYHMHQQTTRTDVDPYHQQQCQEKYQQLLQQAQQLSNCLKQLLLEIQEKTRTFRIYKQHKMYNDPQLNPELYQQQSLKKPMTQLS